MANITIRRKTGASAYEPLYPTTVIDQVTGLQDALDAKISSTEKGAVNGVATLDGSGKVPYAQLPSSVLGGMKFFGTANLSTGTEGSPVELSSLFSSIVNHANFSEADQYLGAYLIVTNTGWIKDSLSVTGTTSGYYFYTPNGTGLGEEEDNSSPYKLEKGDWIVLRSGWVPAANVTAYTFAVINNTYQDATSTAKGVVFLSQSTSTQDSSNDVITEYVLNGLIGTAAGQIAAGDHDHDSVYLGISDTAAAATKWATARTITLTGDVTGTVEGVDGTANISITTTVGDGTHNHTLADITDVTATATELNVLDGIPGTLTATELGYVDGVTSSIQTQLNAKQATITGAATTIATSDLTASRALTSNSSGKVAVSTVTSTELGYVSGVTSSIQTQLNGKANTSHNHDDLYYTETEVDGFLNASVRPPLLWDTAKTTVDSTYPIGTIILDDDATNSGY